MEVTRFAILLLTASTLASQPAQPPIEEDPDAYRIYSVILRTEGASQPTKLWEVDQDTHKGRLSMCITPPKDQEATYRPLIAEFERRNQDRLRLERKFDLPHYSLIGGEEGAPTTGTVFHVSAVGFNPDHTRALVYVDHDCGRLCGSGQYHLMVKKAGAWEPDREFCGAPSCLWAR